MNCVTRKPKLLSALDAIYMETNDTIDEQLLDHRLLRFLLEKAYTMRIVVSSLDFDDGDAVFANLAIKSPLEHLALSNISDSSLETIFQLSKTLYSLILHGCEQITTDGE